MKIKETIEYNLLESTVYPTFEISIDNGELDEISLIELGMAIQFLKTTSSIVKTENGLTIILNKGNYYKGNFENHLNALKNNIINNLIKFNIEKGVNMEIEFKVSKTLKDVFNERKRKSLLKENKKDYFIKSNPELFLNKHSNFSVLAIKLGKFIYRYDMFEIGFLAKFLQDFMFKHNLIFDNKNQETYFDIEAEEISSIIDYLELKHKEFLL